MQRSFKSRLEALEALEALDAEPEDQLPPVASLSGGVILREVLYALQSGAMYCWHDIRAHRFWICETGLRDVALELWYRDMKKSVQPLVDAHTAEIERRLPSNNGDGRVTANAVLSVMTTVLENDYVEEL